MIEIRCRRCNRKLTNPKSVARGVGPVCWKHIINRETVKSYSKSLVEVFCGNPVTPISIRQNITMIKQEVKR